MSNITSNKLQFKPICIIVKIDITSIPVCLIGSDMIRVCGMQRSVRKAQYQVQLEEEGRGEEDLIKMEEISGEERDMFLEEMNFQFALEDWG